jgi:hypothetical protein
VKGIAVIFIGVSLLFVNRTARGQSVPPDRFDRALRELQERIAALEDQNLDLREQLQSSSGRSRVLTVSDEATRVDPLASKRQSTGSSDPQPPAAMTFDELLMLSTQTSERLTSLEDELKQAAAEEAEAAAKKKEEDAKKPKKWFEKYSLRGYTQFRFSEVLDNDGPARPQLVADSSVGDNQSFLIRRARLVLSGDVSDHLSLYIQPDFAVTTPGSPDANHFTQLRDLYADIYLDDNKEVRFRVGQSKVPYGWDNLQSSQYRLPLERNDAINSATRNERDLGIFLYWTPVEIQELFTYINDSGLKGSGNYGMLGLGLYNGQGGSFREQNDDLHAVARFTYPFWLNQCQLVEFSLQGFTGQYSVLSTAISPLGVGAPVRPTGTVETGSDGIQDERIAATFVYYPQPFGFQSEWSVGRGPALNDIQRNVDDAALYGGYAQIMYRQKLEKGEFWPFARWNYYKGGYRSERNAPFTEIQEWEFGTEWQFSKSLELVTMYTLTDRTNTTALSSAGARSYQQFNGQLLRFQLQFNY